MAVRVDSRAVFQPLIAELRSPHKEFRRCRPINSRRWTRPGQEIKDVIDAPNQEEAQATIRQMGYFVTKIAVKKQKKAAADKAKAGRKRGFAIGGVNSKVLVRLHPAALDSARRRSADLAQPANSGEPVQAGPLQEQPDGRLRRDRRRLDAFRGAWPNAPRPSTACTST